MKRCLIFALFNVLTVFCSGQDFTGAIGIQLRILTDQKEYLFSSKEVDGRLNNVLKRFEFIIPINSLKALNELSDLKFLQSFARGNEIITINASLPDDTSPDMDLSYFKGNKSIILASEINIGTTVLEDDLDFNGMLTNGGQGLAFNFIVFLNERQMSFMKVDLEKILEIEITAKGDKIIGLTSGR